MAGTTLNDIFRKQGEILERVERQANALRKGGAAATREIVAGKQQMLDALERRLARAEESRKAEIRRLDEEIEILKAKSRDLKSEIERDLERIRGRGKSGGESPKLTSIKGVGEVAQGRLREHGIRDIKGLAKMKPKELADILGTSAKRSREIIDAAKRSKE